MKSCVNTLSKIGKTLCLGRKFYSPTKKIRQIDGNYVKSAKDFVLGRKFHSQNSLRTKIRQVDEIFGQQRKFPSKILFSKLDGNAFCVRGYKEHTTPAGVQPKTHGKTRAVVVCFSLELKTNLRNPKPL